MENDNRSVIGKSTQTLFSENSKIFFPEISTLKRPIFTSYRIISRKGGGYVLRSKREINLRTLYPVPALRGLKRCKTHVRPRLWLPNVMTTSLLSLPIFNTIDDVRTSVCQQQPRSFKKKERSLFRHLFSRVMASYETIKMHPSCNTSYTRG